MSLYSELKRRNVFWEAIAYLAASWLLTASHSKSIKLQVDDLNGKELQL